MHRPALACAMVPFAAGTASAAVYTTVEDFTRATPVALVADFEGIAPYTWFYQSVPSPYTIAPGVTVSTTSDARIYGRDLLGGWSDALISSGIDETITLTLENGANSVGFNYSVGSLYSSMAFRIVAYDAVSGGNVIYDGVYRPPVTMESESPPLAFIGLTDIGTIYRVELGGEYVAVPVIDNIYVSVIPEPSSLAYTGVIAVGALTLRRRKGN